MAIDSGYWGNGAALDSGYWESGEDTNVPTNADHIRSMSDEELAESLCSKRLTKEMWIYWLKQPWKEEA